MAEEGLWSPVLCQDIPHSWDLWPNCDVDEVLSVYSCTLPWQYLWKYQTQITLLEKWNCYKCLRLSAVCQWCKQSCISVTDFTISLSRVFYFLLKSARVKLWSRDGSRLSEERELRQYSVKSVKEHTGTFRRGSAHRRFPPITLRGSCSTQTESERARSSQVWRGVSFSSEDLLKVWDMHVNTVFLSAESSYIHSWRPGESVNHTGLYAFMLILLDLCIL